MRVSDWVCEFCVLEQLMTEMEAFPGFCRVRVLWKVKNGDEEFVRVFGKSTGFW